MRTTFSATVRVPTSLFVLLFVALLLLLGFTLSLRWGNYDLSTTLYAKENQPEGLGSISGVVREPQGTPVQDMIVSLYSQSIYDGNWNPFFQIQTDEQGRYRFATLGAGTYRVGLTDPQKHYAPRFYPAASDVYAAETIPVNGNNRTAIDLELALGGEITGTVQIMDSQSQVYKEVYLYQKTDGVSLPYWPYPGWSQIDYRTLPPTADTFHFTGLASDEYRICASSYLEGFSTQECYDNVSTFSSGTSISVKAGTVISNIQMVLFDGADLGVISGTVQSESGSPLGGIDVYINQRDTVPIHQNNMLRSLQATKNLSGVGPVASTNIASKRIATANRPLTIPMLPYYLRTTTDELGHYRFGNLPAGTYQIFYFDSTGQYRYEYYDDVTFYANSATIAIQNSEVISNVNAALIIGAQITGTVSLYGEAASNGFLHLLKLENDTWNAVATTTIDPINGKYTFRGLPAGRYYVQASVYVILPAVGSYYFSSYYGGPNWEDAITIKVATGSVITNANIDMTSGPQFDGGIAGRVTNGEKGLSNIQVSLYNPYGCCFPIYQEGAQTYTFTDSDGRYRISGLSYGTYYVRFADPSGQYAALYYPGTPTVSYDQMVAISDTAVTADINMELSLGGMIQGRLYQHDGSPQHDTPVLAILTSPTQTISLYQEAMTANDGTYELSGLYPGDYFVCAGSKQAVLNFTGGQRDCYGETVPPWIYSFGQTISVKAGTMSEKIDILWGRDHYTHLPIIMK